MKIDTSFGVLTIVLLALGGASVVNGGDGDQLATTLFNDIDWTELPDGRAIATVHGNMTSGEHTTFIRFPAGRRTAVHTHSNTYDAVIIGGSARHFEPQLEATADWLGTGSVYHVPADVPHISECSIEADCVFAVHQHGPFDRVVVE